MLHTKNKLNLSFFFIPILYLSISKLEKERNLRIVSHEFEIGTAVVMFILIALHEMEFKQPTKKHIWTGDTEIQNLNFNPSRNKKPEQLKSESIYSISPGFSVPSCPST